MRDLPVFHAPLYEDKASLAHPVRIRVLKLLVSAPQVSGADLLTGTGPEASQLSQHLSVLRRYHLVTSARRGLQMFYALAYPQVADLLAVARALLQEILRTPKARVGQQSTGRTAVMEI
jgi:ArsR family transcriptional regulator